MNTYKITAETATGDKLSEIIVESTEAKARKAFRDIYRHGVDYTITGAEVIRENTCATKDQERAAIEQIRKLLDELGPQSYVATALDGCLEIAEQNIEYDFGDSMKGRVELAEQKQAEAEAKIAELTKQLEISKVECRTYDKRVVMLMKQTLAADDLADCIQLVDNKRAEIDTDLNAAATDIVKFADNPNGRDFQQAVKEHRNLDSEKTYYYNLAARLEAVQQAAIA